MTEMNGNAASAMRTGKSAKVRIPEEPAEDPLQIFARTRKRYGRKITMKDVDKLLED